MTQARGSGLRRRVWTESHPGAGTRGGQPLRILKDCKGNKENKGRAEVVPRNSRICFMALEVFLGIYRIKQLVKVGFFPKVKGCVRDA